MTTRTQSVLLIALAVVVLYVIGDRQEQSDRSAAAQRRVDALSAISIRDVSFRITAANYLRISGRVYNAGREPVRDVRVEARLLDAQGRVIAKTQTTASVGELAPGEANPFELIERAQPDMARFETRIMVEK